MILSDHSVSSRRFLGVLTCLPVLLLLGLLLLAPPDGRERAQIWQFIGRFHPLSVHFPIALLILAPLLELAGRTRRFSYLLPASDFLLGIATCAAMVAALLGWCLARNGGYSGPLVKQHMWGGLIVVAATWLYWTQSIRGAVERTRLRFAMLVAIAAVVSFTGYRGGQLSQGENHLTEFMPAPLADLLGTDTNLEAASTSSNGGPGTFYGARIQPVLADHCVACHGRSKHKSNLRLDNYDSMMRGGKHGPVIRPGDTKNSNLFHRITLPPSDDDFMPQGKKQPLSPANVKAIEQWIATGASGRQLLSELKDLPPAPTPVAEVTFEEINPEAVSKERASVAPALSQFQERFPNILDYRSRGSADLVVSASWMGAKLGDDLMSALAPLADHIVTADLSNTAVTDKSAATIARMKRLRVLRLMHTKIGDATVNALGSLDQLESLSVFDTPVTTASLATLVRLPKLQHVYVGETKISVATPPPPAIKDKLVF